MFLHVGSSIEKSIHTLQVNEVIQWIDFLAELFFVWLQHRRWQKEKASSFLNFMLVIFQFTAESLVPECLWFLEFWLLFFWFFFALQCRSIWQVAGHEMTFHSHVISGFYLIFLLIIYVKLSRALCSSNAVLLTTVSK